MNFKNKKGINPITFLFMSLIIVVLLFIITIFLLQNNDIIVGEDKKNAQLIISKILDEGCFSEKYAIIKEENFNQEKFDKCLMDLNENYVRVNIENNDFFLDSKETEFRQKASFCSYSSSCFEKKIPIIYQKDNFNFKKILIIQIIID